jgi:hypothetical protein
MKRLIRVAIVVDLQRSQTECRKDEIHAFGDDGLTADMGDLRALAIRLNAHNMLGIESNRLAADFGKLNPHMMFSRWENTMQVACL